MQLTGRYTHREEREDRAMVLGLSPRDVLHHVESFLPMLGLLQRGDQATGAWKETGDELGRRAGIGPLPPGRIRIPTGDALWQPDRIDIARMRRDLTVGTTTAGGFLRGTENISFVDLLRNRMVALAMGATRLTGLVGNVTIPKLTAAATGYWLATEGTAITESQQTFQQVALSPRTVGCYTEISRLLQLQSSPAAVQIVTSDLAAKVAEAMDLAALAGTGTEQPQGIIGTSGVGSVSGSTLGAAGCIEFQTDVAANNALMPSFGYVTTPAVASLLMTRPELPTTGTTRLWQGNMSQGTIFNFPAMTSAQVPAATMVAGSWDTLVIGEWGVLELAVNENANFPAGIIGVRAFYTVDVALRYPGAFSVATSIT